MSIIELNDLDSSDGRVVMNHIIRKQEIRLHFDKQVLIQWLVITYIYDLQFILISLDHVMSEWILNQPSQLIRTE